MSAGPRSRGQRRHDTGHRLTHDVDVWVAGASADGEPYLVPLPFDWDGDTPLLATRYSWYRVTSRHIQAWREADELPGRELARDGRWLD